MSEYNEEFDGIRVSEVNQREDGWTFMVELGHGDGLVEYYIDLDREYWTRLTGRRIEPAQLVETTFQFLLNHGSKEVILKKFNLADVTKFFHNYEEEIRRLL